MFQKKISFLGGKDDIDLDEVLNYKKDEKAVEDTDFSPAIKRKILISCLFALTVGNMMIYNVAALLPTYNDSEEANWEVQEDGYELDENDIALILSVFSVAQIIFAPFNALIKNKLGAKNAIVVGFFLLTITTYGLGAIARVKNPRLFKYIAVALRFF